MEIFFVIAVILFIQISF